MTRAAPVITGRAVRSARPITASAAEPAGCQWATGSPRCPEPTAVTLSAACVHEHLIRTRRCHGHAAPTRAQMAAGAVLCGPCLKANYPTPLHMAGQEWR